MTNDQWPMINPCSSSKWGNDQMEGALGGGSDCWSAFVRRGG
jgi:hypothetical protein